MTSNVFEGLSVRYDIVHNNEKREELIRVREKLEDFDERVAHSILLEETENNLVFLAEYFKLYDMYLELIADIDSLGLRLYFEGVYLELLLRDLLIEYGHRENIDSTKYIEDWHTYYDSLKTGCNTDFFYYKQSHRTYQY